jgi:protein-tyrosine-phosphatase
MTLAVLKELGLSTDGLRSKGIDEVDGTFDFVITLCDVAREECPPFAGGPELIHWSMYDPAQSDSSRRNLLPAFRRCAKELGLRIAYLMPLVLAQASDRPRVERS